jgi:hypothetical protein
MCIEQSDLDRLVDDALGPEERSTLLARLERTPDGWRRVACAFLEAQAWRAALGAMAAEAGAGTAPARRPRPPLALALAGIAAGLLAAFALGWAARGAPREERMAALPAPPVANERVADAAPDEPAAPAAPASPLPDALRRRLLQRGYEIAPPQHRVLSLDLKDGRRVAVPVEEVRLKYVKDKVF